MENFNGEIANVIWIWIKQTFDFPEHWLQNWFDFWYHLGIEIMD